MRDLLLHVASYPDPTPAEAIDDAVRFAGATGASLTTLAVQVDLRAPSNYLASRLINLGGVIAEQEAKSLAACQKAIRKADEARSLLGVRGCSLLAKVDLYAVGQHVAVQARTRDLCLVPMVDGADGQRSVAEAVVFGSGRPVLLFRPGRASLPDGALGTVVVAWDGSRTAARAVADALPLLRKAKEVRLLTVINDKSETTPGIAAGAVRHLRTHDIDAIADEVDAAGRKVGRVFCDYAAEHRRPWS
ncbi:MAG: universal stress protein [Phenylobacterium sp.]|uniref:universal stress protein n=1 Tax=Phenylobacterium sp. TaxID=1871053 RepID=UPI001A55B74A|nr:universal stress protein [Phenylobacterium sp.]MBL8774265.1 universal stress protein [Phenylobacterium sp.]